MKCPKCAREIKDNAVFCQYCGEKITAKKTMYCPKCGEPTISGVSFCGKCGHEFLVKKTSSDITYSSPAFILGMIGSVFGFLTGILFISAGTHDLLMKSIMLLTLSAVALVSTLYIQADRKVGGIVMLIVALIFLANADKYGYIEVIFIGLGGLLAVFKN